MAIESELVAVSVRTTKSGLVAALLANSRSAVRVPATVGVNSTSTVHDALDASDVPEQVSAVMEKSLAPVPRI